MRSVRSVAGVALAVAVLSVTAAGAASSPYPATLTMRRGLTFSSTGHALPWGTRLTATQARWVTVRSSGPRYRWGVWQQGGVGGQFPVRSTDGGVHWVAAGPQLASDWAGGSLYYVTRVIGEGPSAVVMVSNSVIDLTTDGGRQWYQYLHAADNWSITAHAVKGAVGLRIGPASYATLPRASYALYVLDVAHHRWRRVEESLG